MCMVGLEDKSWPQPNGSLATTSSMDAQPPEFDQNIVSATSRVTVYGAECSSTSSILDKLGIARLEVQQTFHQNVSRLKRIL